MLHLLLLRRRRSCFLFASVHYIDTINPAFRGLVTAVTAMMVVVGVVVVVAVATVIDIDGGAAMTGMLAEKGGGR
jgi:hypothetical protein